MLKLSDIVEEDKIDLSRLIPKNTRKGFPIETSEDKSKIIVKAKVKRGRSPKPLMLNKFVSFDFCKFLGLFQAEGEKFLNRKGGSGFAFTNVNIKLCKLVVDSLLELGISKEEIKVRILIPSNWDKNKSEVVIKKFLKFLGLPPTSLRKNSINSRKVFFDVAENKVKIINIKNIAFVIRVGRVLFQDIILNSVEIIRKFLSKLKEFDVTSRVLACNFLSGLIMGDGTTGLGKDSKNRTNFFIEIKDPDILNLRECKKLFDKLEFNSTLDDSNPLPRLLIWRCKWDLLVWVLFKNRMLVETPFNWIKLILAITNMQQFKRFNRLVIFKRAITSRKISDVFNLDIKATQVWLRMKEKEGLVKRIDFIKGWGTNKVIWGLTEKGKEMQKLLIEINEFQRRIEDTFKVNSFVEVKELIKNNGNEDLSLKVAQS